MCLSPKAALASGAEAITADGTDAFRVAIGEEASEPVLTNRDTDR
jgi:hypothetical protein